MMGEVRELAPPPTARAKVIDPEKLTALRSLIDQGKSGTDGESYETKGKASGAASRARVALGELDGLSADDLRSRVFPDPDDADRFVFIVGLKAKALKARGEAVKAAAAAEAEAETPDETSTETPKPSGGRGRRR